VEYGNGTSPLVTLAPEARSASQLVCTSLCPHLLCISKYPNGAISVVVYSGTWPTRVLLVSMGFVKILFKDEDILLRTDGMYLASAGT
jgi:hypothetical protein